MNDSILSTIRKLCTSFGDADETLDTDLLVQINTIINRLYQIGIIKKRGFIIEDESTLWSELFDSLEDANNKAMVKSYIELRVKLLFDPPQSSTVMESMKQQIKEFEWCMYREENYNE